MILSGPVTRVRALTILAGTALLLTEALAARLLMGQAPAAGSRSESPTWHESDLCWRGHPAPRCHVFWVTEFAYEHPIATTSTRSFAGSQNEIVYVTPDFTGRIVWTVGPMVNLGSRSAVGGALLVGPLEYSGARLGAEARFRRWLDTDNAIELSGGVIRMEVPRPLESPRFDRATGVTAGVALGSGDLIGVMGRVDVLRDQGHTRVGSFAGVRLGSYAAVAGTVLLAAAALLLAAALKDGYGY